MAYVLIFGWAALASVLAAAARVLRRPLGLALAASLIVFTGMRGDSVDYLNYQLMFELMVDLDLGYPERLFFGKDILFGLLMDGLHRLGGNTQAMFLVSALLGVGLKQLAFARAFGGNTAVPWLVTLCLSFFLHEFTQIRTAIAMPLCFLALQQLLDGRIRNWLILSALAVGFHLSAIVFVPLSAVWLLPPGRRRLAWAALTAGMVAGLLGLFQLAALIDPRLAAHAELTGVNWTALAVAAFELGLVLAIALTLPKVPDPRLAMAARLVWPSVMFVATGAVLLLALKDVASALAFRLYEFFDSFAVFVIAVALLQRRVLPLLLALGYCGFGILLQYLPGLFTPYELAPFSALFG